MSNVYLYFYILTYNYIDYSVCMYKCRAFDVELVTPKKCWNIVASIFVGTSGCHTGQWVVSDVFVTRSFLDTGLLYSVHKLGSSGCRIETDLGFSLPTATWVFVVKVKLTPQTFYRRAVEVPSWASPSKGSRSRWNSTAPPQGTQKPCWCPCCASCLLGILPKCESSSLIV